MRLRIALLIFLVSGLSLQLLSQSRHLKAGDEEFAILAYAKAIPHYQKALKRGEESAQRKLARCHYLLRDYEKAAEAYEAVMTLDEKPAGVWFEYGHVLLQQQRYDEAEKAFQTHAEQVPEDKLGLRFADALSHRERWTRDSARYAVMPLPFNSKAADFSAFPYQKGLVFATAREAGYTDHRDVGQDRYFLDLYYVEEENFEENKWGKPTPLKGELRSKYHESNFSAQKVHSEEVWFSRNELKQKGRRGSADILILKIFSAQMKGLKGDSIKAFPFNNSEFSVTHPFISGDGKRLYFSSDQPGGEGGKDIWISRKEGGSWQSPENLGKEINTAGNEVFPFEHPSGTLFFASNGHPGLGHLDIFSWNPKIDSIPQNVGVPLNSAYDDFAVYLNKDETKGFFSSNRPGGRGDDDLYSYTVAQPDLEILVIDSVSKLPVEGAKIGLLTMEGKRIGAYVTDWTGYQAFKIKRSQPYDLVVRTPDFDEYTIQIRPSDPNQKYRFRVALYNPPPALTALVVDEKSRKGISDAQVSLHAIGKKDSVERNTDLYGRFSAKLRAMREYEMVIRKEGFFTVRDTFSTTKNSYDGDTIIPMKLLPVEVGETFVLREIYYDFEKWDLRPEAMRELDRLASLMKDNPGVSIELGSHTDCRGYAAYNQKLSERRAQSAVNYLVEEKGTPASRITFKGFGESKPVNGCVDGVSCPEADHSENRRTEFTVTGYSGTIERR